MCVCVICDRIFYFVSVAFGLAWNQESKAKGVWLQACVAETGKRIQKSGKIRPQ